MSFLKKIFGSKIKTEHNTDEPNDKIPESLISNEKIADDPYSDSWVNNNISDISQDIIDIIYSKDLTSQKIQEFINTEVDLDMSGSFWEEKEILNFPGPFYTGETDTCATGIIEAPKNVIFNNYCQEFVMIQPRNKLELIELSNAGAVEVFGAYYCDGNQHWTTQGVKDWWKVKDDIINLLQDPELIENNCNQNLRYTAYLKGKAHNDLRCYCFFLEHGYYPNDIRLTLPEL